MSYEAWGEPDDSPFEAAAEAGWLDPDDISKAMTDVMNERLRQWDDEGFSHAHDDVHVHGELASAGAVYASHDVSAPYVDREGFRSMFWPWDWSWWKPASRRKNLVRAAALIIAEIERLDRAEDAQK